MVIPIEIYMPCLDLQEQEHSIRVDPFYVWFSKFRIERCQHFTRIRVVGGREVKFGPGLSEPTPLIIYVFRAFDRIFP